MATFARAIYCDWLCVPLLDDDRLDNLCRPIRFVEFASGLLTIDLRKTDGLLARLASRRYSTLIVSEI